MTEREQLVALLLELRMVVDYWTARVEHLIDRMDDDDE